MPVASIGEDIFRAILQGVPPGAVFALIALGFVLTYKTSGVFNLAFGAQAYVSAAMYFKARIEWGWSIVPALLLAVFVLAPLIGLVLEYAMFRHLRTASPVSKLVVSIGLAVAIPSTFDLIANFEAVSGRTPVGVLPDGNLVFYDPTGLYPWSRDELAQLGVAVAAMLLLGALFRFTSLGLSMRAVVESPRMAELNGVDANRVSAAAWMLSSLFAGLAGVLIAPRFNTLVAPDFFSLVVVAIAAAAIGRLVSLPRALAGGVGLGVFIALFNTFLPRWTESYSFLQPFQDNLTPSLPFVVLFALLIGWPALRRSSGAGDPLSGVDPPPPLIGAAVQNKWLQYASYAFAVVAISAVIGIVLVKADVSWLFLVTQAVVMATIFLSITVITGFAGQISLCQSTFAAIGAFTVFQTVDRFDISPLVALVVGAVIAAAVGALLSLPVIRLGGIWLAIATLAFAYFFDAVVVNFSWVSGGDTALLQGQRVPRPEVLGIDLANDKTFFVFTILAFAFVAVLVIQIRNGTTGRQAVALRASEVAAQSIGISPMRVRMSVFAISAAIAGFGGGLLAILQENVNYATNYSPFQGLFWLVLVATLSARTVTGAAMAAGSFGLLERAVLKNLLGLSGKWRFVIFGITAYQYARHPEGIAEYGRRQSMSRVDRMITRRRKVDA